MKLFTTIYALLLVYIIAALTFWWISLEKQSRIIYDQEMKVLHQSVDSSTRPVSYAKGRDDIEQRKKTRSSQYLGEGITFLAIILVGAAIVYTTYGFGIRLARQQQNFMLSVTHELKSPIAAMKLTLQTLRKHKLEEAKQQQLLDRCISESDRLNELCNNILIASQMEGGQYKSSAVPMDFSALVASCVQVYQLRYPDRFVARIAGGVIIAGEELLLSLAINNLLENAVKYTPADQQVEVSLQQREQRACLQVADHGNGIPDAEKKKVFEKFYRLGNEETRKTKGTGLGLYLTKMIVRYFKGTIMVRNNKPAGSIFELQLPLKQR
jgi:signal transduction histidine kinase